MTQLIDTQLLDLAAWRLRGDQEKAAFVPPGGGDPAAAGGAAPPGMPPDPAMGGAPPAGAPPMDPMAGGAPPMDPAAMGGAPTDIQGMITQAVTQAMAGAGGAGGGASGPGAGPGGKAKIDPGMIYMELGRLRKLMTTMFQNLDWELPPDILDDNAVAQSVMGGAAAPAPLGAGPEAAAPPPMDPAAAGGAPPMDPMAGGAPPMGAVEPKAASVKDMFESVGTGVPDSTPADLLSRRVDILSALSRSLHERSVA